MMVMLDRKFGEDVESFNTGGRLKNLGLWGYICWEVSQYPITYNGWCSS